MTSTTDHIIDEMTALRVIESLRSGVASPQVSVHFSSGRKEITNDILTELEEVADTGRPGGKVISAGYGQGKTHLLNQVAVNALGNNFAVATVVVSKETPIHNRKHLYQKIANSIVLPGEREPGMERRLAVLRPNSDAVQDLFLYADKNFHPKIQAVLKGYFLSSDPYGQFLLYSDLVGESLPLSQIREILKDATGTRVTVEKMPSEDFGQYFHLLTALVRTLKLNGLVILFDEAELLGALGPASRMKAYLNMAPFLGLGGPFNMRFVYSVFFVASGFYADIIVGKRELSQIKGRASISLAKADVQAVMSVLDFLINERVELTDLTQAQIEAILDEVQRLHGIAYHWNALLDVPLVLTKTEGAPLRTVIRGAVESLDLGLLYGGEQQIAVQGLDTTIPGEDEELFATEDEISAK